MCNLHSFMAKINVLKPRGQLYAQLCMDFSGRGNRLHIFLIMLQFFAKKVAKYWHRSGADRKKSWGGEVGPPVLKN